jgi:hypothetical protein
MAEEKEQLADAEEFVTHPGRWKRKEKLENYFGGIA